MKWIMFVLYVLTFVLMSSFVGLFDQLELNLVKTIVGGEGIVEHVSVGWLICLLVWQSAQP